MSKGGGQGAFAQMQEPAFNTGFIDPTNPLNASGGSGLTVGELPTSEIRRIDESKGPEDLARVNAGLGSKGGRLSPYQTDGIVPPPAPPQPDIGPIEQPVPFKGGPVMPRFDLTPIKPQPMPPKPQPMPIDRFLHQQAPIFAPLEQPVPFKGGPVETRVKPLPTMPPRPRSFPFPMPPRMPGRNRQFQMPFFGSSYGRMNPYAGQFFGYGVPSNIFGFAQPHYQPYVPPPPPPPVMQLPPNQGGGQVFSGGFGGQGIGGFGRYNLGLANRQFGGR